MRKVNISNIGDMYVYDHETGAEVDLVNYEAFVSNYLTENARDDSNFMDIGGYEGYYTLLLGKKIKKGTIYTFEPYIRSYEIIKKNVEMHGFNNVKLFQRAIGNKKSDIVLYWRPGAQCISRIFEYPPNVDNNTYYIEHISSICLDDLVDNFGKEIKIDIMKIDIEGGEVELFQGAKKFFSRNKNCKIVLELHCANIRNRGFNLDNFTNDIGDMFVFYNFNMNMVDIKEIRKCLDTSSGNTHYILLPK